MMDIKTLVLCRHAKSDWPTGVSDIKRPLKDRGIQDATQLANLLASQGFRPDMIMSSPAVRAHETAKIFSNTLKVTNEITLEPRIYHDGLEGLYKTIHHLPAEAHTVMMFGHNPTMEDMVTELLGSDAPFELPTCALVCLETYVTQWSRLDTSNLKLRWLLVPRFKRKPRV
ncbi:histidine phosphatase family protein [Pontibacter sp. G13]|uniref:SixA phosphatase family protein n=1 Tax=Pontibacter sp. G13 TaxID=3074898 RepID=UPI0028892238|nr:histidine phosphatase family protein [Pontibacter sp. G13]WNJ16124.1 histidine phosphatase family protein [Pontibacter sp. G13]